MKFINGIFEYKFTKDSIFVFISQIILGLSGLFLNIIVGNKYSADGLGIFNLSFSYFYLFSVVANFGIINSLCKLISEHSQNFSLQKEIFTSAFLLIFFLSIIVAIMLIIFLLLFGSFFLSKNLSDH